MKELYTDLDFTSVNEYYDYINLSFINGNGQGKKLFFDMPKKNQAEFISFYTNIKVVKKLFISTIESN